MSSQRTKELRGAGYAHINDFLQELSCHHNSIVKLVGVVLVWIVDKAYLDKGTRKNEVDEEGWGVRMWREGSREEQRSGWEKQAAGSEGN